MNENQLKFIVESLSRKLSQAELSHSVEQAKSVDLERQLQDANAKIKALEEKMRNVQEED